jgi:hypothetical protein
MTAVPRRVTRVIANSGGMDYDFELTRDGKYPVIPPPPLPPARSAVEDIGVQNWERRTAHGCPKGPAKKYSSVKLFLLKQAIPKKPEFDVLQIQVTTPDHLDIVLAEKLEPPQGVGGNVWNTADGDQQDIAHVCQWWIPATSDPINIELALCLGSKGPNGESRPLNLDTQYWFEKEVAVR